MSIFLSLLQTLHLATWLSRNATRSSTLAEVFSSYYQHAGRSQFRVLCQVNYSIHLAISRNQFSSVYDHLCRHQREIGRNEIHISISTLLQIEKQTYFFSRNAFPVLDTIHVRAEIRGPRWIKTRLRRMGIMMLSFWLHLNLREARLNMGSDLFSLHCIPGLLQCIRLISLMFSPNVSHFNTQYIYLTLSKFRRYCNCSLRTWWFFFSDTNLDEGFMPLYLRQGSPYYHKSNKSFFVRVELLAFSVNWLKTRKASDFPIHSEYQGPKISS